MLQLPTTTRIPILYLIFTVLIIVSVGPLVWYGLTVVDNESDRLKTNEKLLQNTITGSLGQDLGQRHGPVIHAVAAAQNSFARSKNVPSKTNARIVEEQPASRAGKPRRRVDLVPFESFERRPIDRTTCTGSVEARIPSRKAIARGIYPRAQMREPHTVVYSEPARQLPRVLRVEIRG